MQQNPNDYLNLTDDDKLELELIQISVSATYIDIFSIILGLIAAEKAQQLIFERAVNNTQQNNGNNKKNSNKNNKNINHKNGDPNKNRNNNQKNQRKSNNQGPTPAELSAIAACLGVYTILIYTRVAFIRLNQIYNQIQAGTTNFTLTPNINITTGFLYSVVGNLLRAIGVIQRIEEEAEIVVPTP